MILWIGILVKGKGISRSCTTPQIHSDTKLRVRSLRELITQQLQSFTTTLPVFTSRVVESFLILKLELKKRIGHQMFEDSDCGLMNVLNKRISSRCADSCGQDLEVVLVAVMPLSSVHSFRRLELTLTTDGDMD